ncbi:MAG: peptidylprolyl isomerase [Actinomycetota bacterium]
MGTEKRQRKKSNREMGRQMQARAEQRRKSTRRSITIGAIVVVLVGLFFLIAFLTKDDPSSTDDFASSTEAPTESVPTSAAPGDSAAPAGSDAPSSEAREFQYGTGECAPADGSAEQVREFADAPKACIDPTKTYTARVVTNKGEFTITLDPAKAPGTVNSFVNLARFKYFDGTECHRAIPNFVVQCGDPTATSSGGPGYTFADELPADGEYEIGSIAMANSGPDTNGSQFFVITGSDGAGLPPSYSLFGKVTEGLDVVAVLDSLGNPADNGVPPKEKIEITSITITEA